MSTPSSTNTIKTKTYKKKKIIHVTFDVVIIIIKLQQLRGHRLTALILAESHKIL